VPLGEYHAVLYDMQGRFIMRKTFEPESGTAFEMKEEVSGMYTLAIFRDGKVAQVIKVMKQ
jgi:hypothetical protein